MQISYNEFEKIFSPAVEICGCTQWGLCPFSVLEDSLLDCRKKEMLPADSKTVICVLFPYLLESYGEKRNISRYAVVPDYHLVLQNLLSEMCSKLKSHFPDCEFVPFADNSPIPEVKASAFSGIGVVGKNSLLINKKYGSWVFIGEIVTELDVKCDGFTPAIKHCIGCNRCVESCPVNAISENGGIDAEKCLSAVTQRKGELTEGEISAISQSGCIWGCDICQEVCPMNLKAEYSPIKEFSENSVFTLTEETPIKKRAFGWRGRGVINRNLEIISDKNNCK